MSDKTERGTGHRWPAWLPGPRWLLLPIPVALFQYFGVRAAGRWGGWADHHDRGPKWWNGWSQRAEPVPLSPVAVVLVLAGPVCLLWLRRFPRSVLIITTLIAVAYYSLGYPPGPVFLAPLVAMVGWFKILRKERVAQQRSVQRAEAARAAGAERLRIAQELHDVLAHHISLINVQSGVALHLVDDRPEQTRTALAAIKGASKEALTALRGALDALRNIDDTVPRAPTAGLAQLDALVDSVRAAGITVDVRTNGEPVVLAPAIDLAALRIIQESLTNILRHSGADRAEVELDFGSELAILVRDNGSGGAAIPGNGITGMTERAIAVGGGCVAGPARGGGFEVRARLPIP